MALITKPKFSNVVNWGGNYIPKFGNLGVINKDSML